MTKILVTGALGQLGSCIRDAATAYENFEFHFLSKKALNITDAEQVKTIINHGNFDYCINASGYTKVERAESQVEDAMLLNATALKQLSESCKQNDSTLIHFSTDYVFDGEQRSPYTELDNTNPLNVYGTSKLKGEQIIEKSGCKHFIIRTSWLYSQYGHNFLNTVLRLSKERQKLTITTEQTGTPTNANDLANVILRCIESESKNYGVYHYSNTGEATWFDFAESILLYAEQLKSTTLEKTSHYPTFAKRPTYSVLDSSLIKENFHLDIPHWKTSLKSLLLAQNDIF